MEKPNSTFCSRKYSVLKGVCYAEFLAYYTLGNKSGKNCEYQPVELDDNLIENNDEVFLGSYPSKKINW